MRRSKVSSQGQSGGERRSDGGAEIDLDSSPISATPGDEKRSKGARMRGSNMQRRMANRGQPALRLLFGKGVVFVVCVVVLLWRKRSGLLNKKPSPLSIMTDHAMSWTTSTTSAPISKVSILVKDMLATPHKQWPDDVADLEAPLFYKNDKRIHTVSVDGARRLIEKTTLAALLEACGEPDHPRCKVNNQDPEFGLTALHVAAFQGDEKIQKFLMEYGADAELEDSVGRKPKNMTFSAFVKNAKGAAAKRGSKCQIAEVIIPQPNVPNSPANTAALKEVKRLISEGEPVIVRGLGKWLQRNETILYPDAKTFVLKYKDHGTTAASLPYAKKFNVPVHPMTLGDFYEKHITKREKSNREEKGEETLSHGDQPPLYVFEQDGEACHEGFRLLSDFVRHAAPLKGDGVGSRLDKGIICDPSIAGLHAMHYYIGNKGTGAPFHIHSDAINMVLKGKKRWWILPPRSATFSTMHVTDWLKNNGQESPPKRIDTLECLQGPGDVVYVPFDWGHAAVNEEDETFGYTMELTNRRDAYMTAITNSRDC